MSSVRLSVVMTNYNDSRFLEERISSILKQLGPHDEFIFVDDGSTDHSLQIVRPFASCDARLNIIQNPRNLGIVKSANIGIGQAKGIYLTCMAADDRIMPGFIDKTLGLLLENPEYGLCCSDCAMWFDGFSDKHPDKIYTTRLLQDVQNVQFFPPHQIISTFRSTCFWIPGHTAIMKRSLFLKYGGLNENLGPLCDWFVSHAIALESGVIYIPEELSIWRQYRNSYTNQLQKKKKTPRYQVYLFQLLAQKGGEHLRKLFIEAKLTHYYVRHNLDWILLRPKYWDFLFSWFIRVLANRKRKYFG